MRIYSLFFVLHQVTAYSAHFQTPGYPKIYSNNILSVIFEIQLQQHEKISFVNTGSRTAQFEACCDSFVIQKDGDFVINLANSTTGPGETWWEYTENSERGAKLSGVFKSDGSVVNTGLKGTYYIACDNNKNCNGGTCELNRNASIVRPVTCKCPENYKGDDCSVIESTKAAKGMLQPFISTGGTTDWNFKLYPNEVLTFIIYDQKTSEANISLTVGNQTQTIAGKYADNKHVVKISGSSGRNVSVVLLTKPGHLGNPAISYNISCTPGYCNSGKCHLNRTLASENPPFCECGSSHLTGLRCNETVHSCPLNCSGDSKCVWTNKGRYACECSRQGYIHNGTSCNDVNECESAAENPCSPTEICVNTPGSFSCECSPDHQALQTSSGIECVFSGCAFPWTESKDGKCYMTEGSFNRAKNASEYCETRLGAVLAEARNIDQIEEIGSMSRSALVWIGLTDEEGEGKWKWTRSATTPSFTSWGPGFPEGTGDFAVLYPNRWTTRFQDCSAKKRFICEATDPFCPSEWTRLENVPKKCFFQSTIARSFDEARDKCAEAAVDGKLATWSKETLVNFKPIFWDTAPGEGLAQFWIDHQLCVDKQCSPITSTSFNPGVEARRSGAGSASESCAFLFPNKWADYKQDNSEFRDSLGPTVACQRRSSFALNRSTSAIKEDTSDAIEFSRTTKSTTTSVNNWTPSINTTTESGNVTIHAFEDENIEGSGA